jgi:hypothetical protein
MQIQQFSLWLYFWLLPHLRGKVTSLRLFEADGMGVGRIIRHLTHALALLSISVEN